MEFHSSFTLPPMLAVSDSLITMVVIIAISALASFFKKKSEGKAQPEEWTDEGEAPPVRPVRRQMSPESAPPSPPKVTDWEAELRRLLGGEEPAPPPPVIAYEPPKPATSPPRAVVAPLPSAGRPVVLVSNGEMRGANRAPMAESTQAYGRASQLDSTVVAHLARRTHTAVGSTSAQHRTVRSPEVNQVLTLFRNSRSTRQAVIAAVILGAPPALEGDARF